ncbi:pentraxin fusion protein-like [Bolinopsis microptera]|uniref:pentraxin fusion protein-like n=1 Tax=Bolinopsis microptera TaxID=2820187 RepID=UPI00307B0F08
MFLIRVLLCCATLSTLHIVQSEGSCKKLPIESGLMSSVFKNLDAELALDGDMETFCHSELESEPFILLMFENSRVGDVKIKNVQEDCCWDQLNGAEVSVLNDDMDAILCGLVKVEKTDKCVTVNCKGAVGTYVKVEIPGEKFLHIREIEVFKKCPADEMKEEEKKEDGGDDRCSNGLSFCDGVCKHIHMCGKNYG